MDSYRVYFKENFKEVPDSMDASLCYGSLFGTDSRFIVIGIPINIKDTDNECEEYFNNTNNEVILDTKDFYRYISYIKRIFGGIYKKELVKKYRFDNRYHIDGLFLFIDTDKIKIENKQLGLKIILTMIRYLFENGHRDLLHKAFKIYHSKSTNLDLMSILLNCHLNSDVHPGHSLTRRYAYYRLDNAARKLTKNQLKSHNPFVRFKKSNITKSLYGVQDTLRNMPVIKNIKLKQLIYDEVSK